jgi:PKHD-type hydroxylase
VCKELNIKEPTNSVWPFELDSVCQWAYWEKAFTEEECQKIIDIGNALPLRQGITKGNVNNIRESQTSWIYPSNDTKWMYERMTDIISSLNARFFKFDLFGAAEGFQFTKYSAPSGRYGKHVDSSDGSLIRKLSFTLQLSKPEDYKGGELCLHFSDKPEIMKKDQGYVALFPSYVLHEVKAVTEGTRYSLVSWITGKPFK